jgi:Asp/Glu/hydantoin racemase
VAGHIWSAADAGADAILVTCSSIGPAVDATAPFMDVPLMRVDEGMADRASELGSRIGIAATLSTTLDPTRDLVERLAQAKGRSIKTVAKLCEGAFERLAAGDREGHDAIVSRGIAQLADEVDVILLAQASMARVLEGEGAPRLNVPVLSSPETGILHLRTSLESNAAAARG